MNRLTFLNGAPLKTSLGRICVGTIIVGFCAMTTGQVAMAGTGFPGSPTRDTTDSMGAFQLVVNPDFAFLFAPKPPSTFYYPGYDSSSGVLTSPLLIDTNATTIDLGASHPRNVPSEPYFPNDIIGTAAGAPFFPDTISNYNDYAAIPFSFVTEPNSLDEILTEIESFSLGTLSNLLSCGDSRVPAASAQFIQMVSAGPDQIPNLPRNRRSIGMVQQLPSNPPANDFPAQSFFDIFVEVNLPQVTGNYSSDFPLTGAVLYNDAADPLIIVNTNLTTLPPGVVYIHGQTTAVPLIFKFNNLPYWAAGDILGYLTLAGHGVFSNTCMGGSTGQSSNCNICAEAQTVLNTAFGPVGSPATPMPVPWLRSSNLFPTPGTGYNSLVNRPASGAILDAVVNFPTNTGTLYAEDFAMSNLTNSLGLPPFLGSVTYTNSNTVLQVQLSVDGVHFSSATATGLVSLSIVSTNTPSGSTTVYGLQVQQLTLAGTSAFGPVWFRADPTTASLGQHTSKPDGSNYDVSSIINVFFDISTDNVHWIPANGSICLQVSLPPPAPHHISIAFGSSSNSVVLNWGGSFPLQSTTNMSLPFADVPGPVTNAPYTNIISGVPQEFFRLRN